MKEIFIVEDDDDIRELIEYLLKSLEYKVQAFATAEEFTKYISSNTPDLILLDIMLPDGNGLDICKNLSQNIQTLGIPIILMSAHADASNLEEHCAQDFIAKPFDIDDLITRISQQLN